METNPNEAEAYSFGGKVFSFWHPSKVKRIKVIKVLPDSGVAQGIFPINFDITNSTNIEAKKRVSGYKTKYGQIEILVDDKGNERNWFLLTFDKKIILANSFEIKYLLLSRTPLNVNSREFKELYERRSITSGSRTFIPGPYISKAIAEVICGKSIYEFQEGKIINKNYDKLGLNRLFWSYNEESKMTTLYDLEIENVVSREYVRTPIDLKASVFVCMIPTDYDIEKNIEYIFR